MTCKKMTDETRKWIHERYGHLWPDDPVEKPICDEARNIALNAPLWPGDTISHATAKLCGERGWAKRDDNGYWVPTEQNPFFGLKE